MEKLKTLIVDDEPLALQLLSSYLEKIDDIKIVGQCSNGKQALAAVAEYEPDLLFLDIEMPVLNGLEVVKNLQADILPMVIFTTAYEQYALQAFDVHAVDYILKPIDTERIERAVQRARDRAQAEQLLDGKPAIIQAIEDIDQRSQSDGSEPEERAATVQATDERKVVIKDRDVITLLDQSEIEWIDAAGDYVCLHSRGETHIKRSTMKDLLEELDTSIFQRVHRSTIVNLKAIEKITPLPKGEFLLHVGEFDRIKVSRKYREVITRYLGTD